jgi:hypothetical protein
MECKAAWKSLSEEYKRVYEELSNKAQGEYKRQIKSFYAQNPGIEAFAARLKEDEARNTRDRDKKTRERRKETRAAKVSAKPKSVGRQLKKMKTKLLNLPDPYEDAPQPPPTPTIVR